MPPAHSKSADSSPDADPNERESCRPTFSMTTELLAAIDEQCAAEGSKKRSPFVSEILHVVLTSAIGQELRSQALANQHTLVEELKRNLILFNAALPIEQIRSLAASTHRNPDQMVIHLILMGLQLYQESHASASPETSPRS